MPYRHFCRSSRPLVLLVLGLALVAGTFSVTAAAVSEVPADDFAPRGPLYRNRDGVNAAPLDAHEVLAGRHLLADVLADSAVAAEAKSASAAGSTDQSSSSTTTTTTTTTTKKPTTTKLVVPTTTSSRAPNPVTTAAPKVAQWTGIAVAIVAVAALIVGLVLCKLKSKEQCCFRPKPRAIVCDPQDEPMNERSKSPSDLSSTGSGLSRNSRTSERSFHEAAVDPNGSRRSLLDLHADTNKKNNAGSQGGDSDSDDDDDAADDVSMSSVRTGHATTAAPAAAAAAAAASGARGSDPAPVVAMFHPVPNTPIYPPPPSAEAAASRPATADLAPRPPRQLPPLEPSRPPSEAPAEWSPLESPAANEALTPPLQRIPSLPRQAAARSSRSFRSR